MPLALHNIKKGSFICLFFVLFIVGCGPTNSEKIQEYKLAGNALGTTYHITYLGTEIVGLNSQIDSLLTVFNYGVSTYDTTSFISHYNNNKPLHLNDLKQGYNYLGELFSMSLPIVEATKGAFDPSAAELFKVYDHAKKRKQLMDTILVSQALSNKGLEPIVFTNDGMMASNNGKQLNFNAIAKGYFVDLLGGLLEKHGSQHYMVEVGGEVRCKGVNKQGTSWNIGINVPKPGTSSTEFFEIISLSDMSMATSGNYQNFYEVNGEVIGHTLDPRSGKPVISDLKSATIMHKDCAVADAYATACMVIGLDSSISLIENDTSLSAFFIFEENGSLKGRHVPK